MANKKPAPKKVSAKSTGKPADKKTVKPAAKPVAKKPVAKPAAKKIAPAAKKAVAKPAAKKPTPVAKKPVAKPAAKKPTPVVKKAVAKPAAKKPTPVAKKPVAKPAAKKPTPVVKKAVAKPAAKKPTPVAKKAVAKPAAKKPTPVAKKAVAKPAVKKSTKPVAKPVVNKTASKPVKKTPTPKSVSKTPVSKSTPKVLAKVVEKKAETPAVKKQEVKKVVIEKPLAVKSTSKSGKKTPTKTLISSTTPLPKKSDVYKTNTFASNTLKNDTGKVIAHRKTSELKRKSNDGDNIKRYEPESTRSILDMGPVSEGPSFRYSDDDLAEFRELLIKKQETAKSELQYLQGVIMRKDEGGTEDTENKYQNIEDGGASMEREQFNQLASRQITFISHLEQALVRIENKTYGICRETGKLIDKARLRAVPHATLSIEAKNAKKS